jgi:hypothetical protein
MANVRIIPGFRAGTGGATSSSKDSAKQARRWANSRTVGAAGVVM